MAKSEQPRMPNIVALFKPQLFINFQNPAGAITRHLPVSMVFLHTKRANVQGLRQVNIQ